MTCFCCRNISSYNLQTLIKIRKSDGAILWSRQLTPRGPIEFHNGRLYVAQVGTALNPALHAALYPHYNWPIQVLDGEGNDVLRIGEGFEDGPFLGTGGNPSFSGNRNIMATAEGQGYFSLGGDSTPRLEYNVFSATGSYLKTVNPFLGSTKPISNSFVPPMYSFGPYAVLPSGGEAYHPTTSPDGLGRFNRAGAALFDSNGDYVGNIGHRRFSPLPLEQLTTSPFSSQGWVYTPEGVYSIQGYRGPYQTHVDYIPHITFWSYTPQELPTAMPDYDVQHTEVGHPNRVALPVHPAIGTLTVEYDKADPKRIVVAMYSSTEAGTDPLKTNQIRILTRNGSKITFSSPLYPKEVLTAAGVPLPPTGTDLGQFVHPAYVYAPIIIGDVVYFSARDSSVKRERTLYAMSLSGSLLWTLHTVMPTGGFTVGDSSYAPFTDGENLYYLGGQETGKTTTGNLFPQNNVLLKITPAGEVVWAATLPESFKFTGLEFGLGGAGADPYRHQTLFDDQEHVYLYNGGL